MKKSTKSIIVNFVIMTGNGVIATAAGILLREGAKEKSLSVLHWQCIPHLVIIFPGGISGRKLLRDILRERGDEKVTTVE